MSKPDGRAVAVCAGCSEDIIEGTGWRRLPAEGGGWLDYHHEQRSEPSQATTVDGQHFRRDVVVVRSCVPKPATRKAAA